MMLLRIKLAEPLTRGPVYQVRWALALAITYLVLVYWTVWALHLWELEQNICLVQSTLHNGLARLNGLEELWECR